MVPPELLMIGVGGTSVFYEITVSICQNYFHYFVSKDILLHKFWLYSKTCLKCPLKNRQNKDLKKQFLVFLRVAILDRFYRIILIDVVLATESLAETTIFNLLIRALCVYLLVKIKGTATLNLSEFEMQTF